MWAGGLADVAGSKEGQVTEKEKDESALRDGLVSGWVAGGAGRRGAAPAPQPVQPLCRTARTNCQGLTSPPAARPRT